MVTKLQSAHRTVHQGDKGQKDAFGSLLPWSEPSWTNSLSSPFYNDSHRRLRDALRSYIDAYVLPDSLEWEDKGEAPRAEAKRYAASGFAFADVPDQYRPEAFMEIGKGTGIKPHDLDAFHFLVMTDETSRVEGGVMVSLSGSSVIGIPPSMCPLRPLRPLHSSL